MIKHADLAISNRVTARVRQVIKQVANSTSLLQIAAQQKLGLILVCSQMMSPNAWQLRLMDANVIYLRIIIIITMVHKLILL